MIVVFVASASFVGLLAALLYTRSKLKHARLAERVESDVEAKEEERARRPAPPRERTA
jgi:Flp pilus assembly protein TadB